MSKTKSPLKTELANLQKKIKEEDDRLSEIEDEFFEEGGTCCPFCGVPGFSEASLRQENRQRRVGEINSKIALSSSPLYKRGDARMIISSWLNLSNDLQPLHVDRLYRYMYLCEKFKVRENHLSSFLKGTGGIKHAVLQKMTDWCDHNKDFIFPH